MTSVTQTQIAASSLTKVIETGVVAGLVGGGVFGVQMIVGGMMPMIAQMVGSESVVIGFVLHLLISAVIGATYGVLASRLPSGLALQTTAGAIYGIVWWVLGALIIMPLALGMGEMVLQIQDMQLMSLLGHVVFGIIMAVSFVLLRDK